MKLKKFLTLAIAVVLIIASAISASAVEHINTGIVTMNGYELYGSLTVYPLHAEGHTYCEYASSGKSAKTTYAYRNTDGVIDFESAGSAAYDYTVKTSLTETTENIDSSVFDTYLGAVTYSKVKYPGNESHYVWVSDTSETPLRLGYFA